MAIAYVYLVIIPMFIGIIFLQIYLSKKENKWAGLILPFITLAISIICVLGITVFSVARTEIIQDGKRIVSTVNNIGVGTLLTAVYVFVLYNISTGILFAIYAGCRNKRKKNEEIDKMNIQDL